MDFALTPSQRDLQERARAAIGEVVVPIAASVGPGERLGIEAMRALYRGLAPLGYVGSTVPKEAGGAGLTYVDYGLLLEALAAGPI
ncbi:MAG TPA: acyl-CoA dehydrogenase family protein, partial [Beijerinckiaceae bacterium]|nr:acyl-CoA dehydrogenase family protein [Beijerinckiaceae bacterium]